MKNVIDRIATFNRDKQCMNVVVETPKGSQIKYAYDPESGLFRVKLALPEGMVFPFNFGFIPGTRGEDGDPLDILILNQQPLAVGCLVDVRVVGIIKAKQTERGSTERNDRLIGLGIGKETPTSLDSVTLDDRTLAEIEHFFVSYNRLTGKRFTVLGTAGRAKALKMIRQGQKAWKKDS